MKAAQVFVRCLENEAIEYIFGIPGEENLDVMDALLDSDIRFVTVRHEQGAAFMADVYGRLTGRTGMCLSTSGPGATNLITGVADANMDHSPLVAIAGQADTHRLHKESHQVLDLEEIFRSITKYSSRLLAPDTITEITRKAFNIAQTEKTGACFIEFPENIAKFRFCSDPLPVTQPPVTEPTTERVQLAAKLISQARQPIILAGNWVVRANASQALAEFAEQFNIPLTKHLHG
jgi:acetolactate synthase-1/2/3 large subunit